MTFPLLTSEDVIAGRWQILRRINSGGAAAVYAVKELGGEGVFALKVVHRNDEGNAKRLKAEFETLSCLDHPNLIRVHEQGEEREMCYYTMDLIPGAPLREFIQAGMLTLVESLDLYRQVLHVIAYLHKNEVVHRDIKSGNILVDRDRNVTLIDLGVCRSPLREKITEERFCTGTADYMSPEQAAVSVGVTEPAIRRLADSPHADIYALGVLLYHLLSGQWPHGKSGKSENERAIFLRRRATEKPAMVEFPNEELGRLAMAMLLPVHQGRPSNLSGMITTFEAAFAAMREDSQQFSPLCADEAARLARKAEGGDEEHRNEAPSESEAGESGEVDPSDAYTRGKMLRVKLAGFGFLSAAGAMGGIVALLVVLPMFFLRGPDRAAVASAPKAPGMTTVNELTLLRDSGPQAGVYEFPWLSTFTTSPLGDIASLTLRVKLITGPVPGQKLYPCNLAVNEIPWKGGCWQVLILEGGTREERVAGCKTSQRYEPEPGWCERSGGQIYYPINAAGDVKPPTAAVDSDSPNVLKDPKGDKAVGGSGK